MTFTPTTGPSGLVEQCRAALNAMMDAWFDYHDAHSLTQPVTGAAGNAFDMALAARDACDAALTPQPGEAAALAGEPVAWRWRVVLSDGGRSRWVCTDRLPGFVEDAQYEAEPLFAALSRQEPDAGAVERLRLREALERAENSLSVLNQFRLVLLGALSSDREAARSAELAFDSAWASMHAARAALSADPKGET